jgi:hypothetical protein
MPPQLSIILYFQGLLFIYMGKHGNKYQVNLHSQKIAKISIKTCMLFP